MKKVLIFVLSANIPPYRMMIDNSMETWDAEPLQNCAVFYYSGNPPHEHGRVISFPVEEDYNTIGCKDLAAYQWALDAGGWDYMARVNASCYVHKRRLLDYCQHLPERGLMRGIVSPFHPYCGIDRPFMWGGGQFIFSRDVIEAFVANKQKWRHDLMEDVAMSELARECGIDLDNCGDYFCSIDKQGENTWSITGYGKEPCGGLFSDWKDVADTPFFYFRVKHDPDRRVDGDVMRLLKKHLPA